MDFGVKELGYKNKKRGLYRSELEKDACGAGFICHMAGKKSHDIIHKALEILVKLTHRGAVGADPKDGDGAGILIQIPHNFFAKKLQEQNITLENEGDYACGMMFLPKKDDEQKYCISLVEQYLKEEKLELITWRDVPVNSDVLGRTAKESEPSIKQVFIKKGSLSTKDFNFKLYVLKRRLEKEIASSSLEEKKSFYIPSLSSTTLIFKGLLVPVDMERYYDDLVDQDVVTALALVHQRFSTNTFPTWDLAQPFRYLCHNGEINTYRGNINWMKSRESSFYDEKYADDLEKIKPVIIEGRSDSASMDNALELLLHTGRSLPEAMMMLIPEAWENHQTMDKHKKDFYKFNACTMEPWDGPASVPFTDGKMVGAVLDRNGLRPSRYTVTKDDYVIMSSETGVVDVAPENVLYKGRLQPGKMFLVDMQQGRIIEDQEIKDNICKSKPYDKFLKNKLVTLSDLKASKYEPNLNLDLITKQKAFAYTREDISTLIAPMIAKGKEAIGSMGTDTPLAILSKKSPLLYDYFKQLFAQVTNPPLDGIREQLVTAFQTFLGASGNLFTIEEQDCNKLFLSCPILDNDQLQTIKDTDKDFLQSVTLDITFEFNEKDSLRKALDSLRKEAKKAVENSASIIILSDRNISKTRAAIPALLACSAIHHYLTKEKLRNNCSIVVESGEVREVHHFAMLFGYGCSAINPYLAYETINEMIDKNIVALNYADACINYIKAIEQGLVKIMSKMGISTLQSYCGAQIFEALGLKSSFVDEYFTKTVSRIEGIGLEELSKEILTRHNKAFEEQEPVLKDMLESGGQYKWRRNGESHMFSPLSVAKLQDAVRRNNYDSYKEFSDLINQQSEQKMTLRGLLKFKEMTPVPLEEVEPWTEIVKRFKTGAMSYGSISEEAHENLAIAMNELGGKSNSGEGGEKIERLTIGKDGKNRNSAIKQVASGRFGVTSNYLSSAKEIQIKMAQGAKPGEGGQLPGEKVYPWIAKTRHSTPYVGLISPPPHHDIYSIEDLSQLIFDLKNANRSARINVKLVSEAGVGTIAAGVAKAKADVVLISGFDGGTGASPLTSLKHCGLPWELGLAETHQTLVMNDLRGRIVVECDGQLKTGRDVAIACLLGAEEFGFATAPLVASGCIMMRACHLNTCPVGIATQDPELRKKFTGTPEHVINYFHFVAEELRKYMSQLGFRKLSDMIGAVNCLEVSDALDYYKIQGLDFSEILYQPKVPVNVAKRCMQTQDHELENVLDIRLLKEVEDAIKNKDTINITSDIKNTDRATGAIISNEISKLYGEKALPKDTLNIHFKGSAGQSFGAFATKGITFTLEGDANDYLAKGLSGAKIIVIPPKEATFVPKDNIIVGNVLLYGATKGEVYIRGKAGERFCVRNSGATAVVEGVGDHACEYMTGGKAVILGEFGRNFAAGMSGGVAYVYDPLKELEKGKCNQEMVHLEDLVEQEDIDDLRLILENHYQYTKSRSARDILDDYKNNLKNFTKIMPIEYKKALKRIQEEQQTKLEV